MREVQPVDLILIKQGRVPAAALHSNHQTNYIIHKIISKFRILWATIDIPQRSIAPVEEEET